MKMLFGLQALSAMINTEVRQILPPTKLDISMLASASIDFMLTNLLTTPHLEPNLDFIANPNLFEYSAKLDKYLLEFKLINNTIPYSTDQLRTIFSEICTLIYLDIYHHLKGIVFSYGLHYVRVDYSVLYCDYNKLTVEFHGIY